MPGQTTDTRLCALIPPPYYPLTRFHGVLAQRAKLRKAIVPRPPAGASASCCAKSKAQALPADRSICAKEIGRVDSAGYTEVHAQLRGDTATVVDASRQTLPSVQTHMPLGACRLAQMLSGQAVVVDAHNVLSMKHWDRIGQGVLYAGTSAVPWAILHARTFDQDVLRCGSCGGHLRVRAVIADPALATGILVSLSTSAGQGGPMARGPPSGQLAVACSATESVHGGANGGGSLGP